MGEPIGHVPQTSIFPDDWSPTYDIVDVIDDTINDTAATLSAYNSIANILSSSSISSLIPDTTKLTAMFGIQGSITDAQLTLSQLQDAFCKNLDLSESFNGIDNILTSSDTILKTAETVINSYDGLEKYAQNIMDRVEYTIDYLSKFKDTYLKTDNLQEIIDAVGEKIDKFIEGINKYVSNIKLDTFLSTLPDKIIESIFNLSIVQDLKTSYTTLVANVTVVTTSLSSLKGASSISVIKSVIKTLRTVISIVQDIKSQVDRVQQSIERLNALVSNTSGGSASSYLSTAMSLAGGNILFFERISSYAAKYPYNLGFRTVGGIVFEADSTPEKQRIELTMPSGSGVKMSPKGDIDIKATAASQFQSKGEMEIHGEKDITITATGNVRIVASGNTRIETNGTTLLTSVGSTVISSGTAVSLSDCSVSATGNCTINAGMSTVVTSEIGTEISSNGMLTLSGKTINMVSEGYINMTAGGAVTCKAGGVFNVLGSNVNIKGALISLN